MLAYKITALVGVLSGFALIGVGIGLSLPAVIIGGVFLLAISAVGGLLARMRELYTILHGTIPTSRINKVTLLGARAHTSHVRRIGGGAAAGLGLVIAEDKEAVGTGLEFGA